MAEPFLSEIRLFSFNFPPKTWAQCDGQLLPINQNQALFALLGTTYGGDGRVNFALPDLRARASIHRGSGHTLGERAGEQAHTLLQSELPTHTHSVVVTNDKSNSIAPATNARLFANSAPSELYNTSADSLAPMAPSMVSSVGGTQPHNNMQPYLVLNFCIALSGIFPSQT